MNKLYLALGMQMIGGIIAFFQLQGWMVWPDRPFLRSLSWMYLTSLAIAPLCFYSTKMSYEHFGAFWNMRLAGFGLGTIIFGVLSWWLIGEIPTLKTVICILLAIAIILIQITNLQ